jgi:prepilin-type N-terminal cleavage/methylation domain-containing protein
MTTHNGFSLIELLLALTITLIIGLAGFHVFRQNALVFHDQNFVMEMQQSARAAASQIQDEIRQAGQGVPIYSMTYDSSPSEASVSILAGSDSTRLNLRAGLANAESSIIGPLPVNMTLGSPVSVTVASASVFSDVVGTNPTGRYIYVWGPAFDFNWAWVRAAINSITASTNSIQLTPAQAGDGGRVTGFDGLIRFTAPPTISLEEAIALYRDSATDTIRRTTAANMTNPASPVWAAANDLTINATLLTFIYYDRLNNVISPSTLANRALVTRIDARVVVQTAEDLSTGNRGSFALPVRSTSRNLALK